MWEISIMLGGKEGERVSTWKTPSQYKSVDCPAVSSLCQRLGLEQAFRNKSQAQSARSQVLSPEGASIHQKGKRFSLLHH